MIDEMPESALDLVVAGTADAVLMVESEAKELSEDVMLGAVMYGQKHFQPVLDAIVKLAERAAKEPWDLKPKDERRVGRRASASSARASCARPMSSPESTSAAIGSPPSRTRSWPRSFPPMTMPALAAKIASAFKEAEKDIVRSSILNTKTRIDGRDLTTVRPIVCEVGILPRTHGSALFTRGETQALAVATLGTGEDEQYVDALAGHL